MHCVRRDGGIYYIYDDKTGKQESLRTFSLEFATNLASSTVWQTNPTAPVVIGGLNVVTNPISSKHQFYRLTQ